MKLNKVCSNITTKLLAHYAYNIEAFQSWSVSIKNPGTMCVRWIRFEEEDNRFEGQYASLITGYSFTQSTAPKEEVWDTIENNTVSFASDSALSFIEAEMFVGEFLTDEEVSILSDYLVSLGCNVEAMSQEFPVAMEDAVPELGNDPSQPFHITLSTSDGKEFSVVGIVDDGTLEHNFILPDKE